MFPFSGGRRHTRCRPDARVRGRNPALAGGFPMRGAKQFTGTRSRNVMGTGFLSELYAHVGQWGTHVDPPAHFIKGLRTVDQIDPKEMVLPLVIIDVHDEATKNPDYTLSLERVKK